jgi:alkylation response protein AidB-like acyl-CoA dehydrogenase
MDFKFTSEQNQLRDSARRYLADHAGFEARKKVIHGAGVSAEVWQGMAELGLMSVPVPEAHGGFGGNGVDLMVVMEELGRAIVVEPFFASVVMGAALVRFGGTPEQQAALLPQVADGSLKLAAALNERQARHELFNVSLKAEGEAPRSPSTNGFRLVGEKSVVLHGAQADKLIVSARTSGAARDKSGITLFVVDRHAAGLSLKDVRTIDGMRAADATFSKVEAQVLGAVGEGYAAIERAAQVGMVALCAEAIGCFTQLNEMTLEYLKTRKQFGVPIGKFQALQHRMTDMFMELEQARSLTMLAAVKLESDDPTERARAVHAAKVRVGRAAKRIGQEAIQLHGGMGMTDELAVSHYFKRVTMIEATLGDTDHHLAAFAALTAVAA